MANCMLGFPNRADEAALSGGAWTAGLPLANLQTRALGRPARSANLALASTKFNATFTAAKKLQALALVNHNLSLAAKYRVRVSNEGALLNLSPSAGSVNGAWFNGNLPNPNNDGGFPDPAGGNAASRWVCASGGFVGRYLRMNGSYGTAIMVDGETYTVSFFVRLVSGSGGMHLGLEGVGFVYFDFGSMSVVSTDGVYVGRVVPHGDGWYRIAATFPGYTGNFSTIVFYRTYGTFEFDVFGDQIEVGQLSSYTPGYRAAGAMDNWQSYDYDSGWQDVWPIVYPHGVLEWEDDNWWSGKYTLEEIAGYIHTWTHILPKAMLARTIRVELSDPLNSAGYVQAGRLFVGSVWQPKLNMIYGAGIGWETDTSVQKARSGAEYFDERAPYRVQRFTLDAMSEDEAFSRAFELQRRAGISREILFIHDPDDTVHALRRRFLGRLRQLSLIEYPNPGANSAAFELKELR